MVSLQDKVVLITGSSKRIGAATAKEFAKEGCKIVITYNKSQKEAKEVQKELASLGAADTLVCQLDVMDDKSIGRVVDKVVKKFGGIDILINNAGVLVWKTIRKQTFSDIKFQIRTNLEGLIKLTNYVLPHLKEAIINISSAIGLKGTGMAAVYSATKFGVRGFTQSLAQEEPNLKIYSVNPTSTATDMNDFSGQPPEEVAVIIVKACKGEYNLPSGSDINVWEV